MTKQDFFVESLVFVLNHDIPKSLPPLSEMIAMFEAKEVWIDDLPQGDRTPNLHEGWLSQVQENENVDDV